MVEVNPRLWVGGDDDVGPAVVNGLKLLHCAKNPWHLRAVGYLGSLKPDHPDYLFKVSPHFEELALNLVDAPFEPPEKLVDAALIWLDSVLLRGERVLVHCNQGESRGPTIAYLWLHSRRGWVLEEFRFVYPRFNPREGMRKLIERRTSECIRHG